MRIHIPYISDQSIGGGYTFYRNFIKAAASFAQDIELVEENQPYDILFGFSPTTVSGEVIERAKAKRAKFVLRMDGVPEDNRNAGRGTRRLVEYALKADLIIYQGQFIFNTVGMILRNNGANKPHVIIPNGVDTDVYRPDGEKIAFKGQPNILAMAYRKDNNKRYEETLAMYREYWMSNKQANLVLIGRYPTEWQDYNMGFFNGERYQRLGVVTDDLAKASMIRSCDFMFYPSFADPAPNAVMEALACGVPVLYNPYGGVSEMVYPGLYEARAGQAIEYGANFKINIDKIMFDRKQLSMNAVLIAQANNLKTMITKYRNAFEMVTDL